MRCLLVQTIAASMSYGLVSHHNADVDEDDMTTTSMMAIRQELDYMA